MVADGTLVDECVELPYPEAGSDLLDHVAALGICFEERPTRPECVFELLRWCIRNGRVAMIQYLTDVDGNPWRTKIEPHGFNRSKEGFRVRCFRPAEPDEPDVVSDFQTDGWHLYLVEDIEYAEATDQSFARRPYSREQDEISITISFRAPAV
jgi:hypothetical protein